MKRTFILYILALVLPAIAYAQQLPSPTALIQGTTSETFADVVKKLLSLVNIILPVLVAAAVALVFFGLVRFIYNAGDSKSYAKGKDTIIWGLVGLFCILTLGGLVALLKSAFLP